MSCTARCLDGRFSVTPYCNNIEDNEVRETKFGIILHRFCKPVKF